jgi:hypothetical protein
MGIGRHQPLDARRRPPVNPRREAAKANRNVAFDRPGLEPGRCDGGEQG